MFSIRAAGASDTLLLDQLMQLYFFEASSWSDEDLALDGRYDCDANAIATNLRTSPGWARILLVNGNIAGFVLVEDTELESTPVLELADLFVLPKYRRSGLATWATRELLTRSSERWLIAVFRRDLQAYAYWARALRRLQVEFHELPEDTDGAFRLFTVEPRKTP